MGNRVPDASESVVPFAAKPKNLGSNVPDQLEAAGQTILGLLQRAASAAETNQQQAVEFAHKLSAQLKAAENRIKALEADVRAQAERADRAERWLYKISLEIEQKFFGTDHGSHPQVGNSATRNYGR